MSEEFAKVQQRVRNGVSLRQAMAESPFFWQPLSQLNGLSDMCIDVNWVDGTDLLRTRMYAPQTDKTP